MNVAGDHALPRFAGHPRGSVPAYLLVAHAHEAGRVVDRVFTMRCQGNSTVTGWDFSVSNREIFTTHPPVRRY